ncbi:MAG: phospholipid carrier-dependent glycosyltransferase [Planctomycetota bacterium]
MDWHSDEWNLSKPITELANTATTFANTPRQGQITRYNWPGVGVIRITGYSLYALKGWFGPYSTEKVLIILRVLSALTATVTVLFVFIALRKLGFSNGALLGSALVAVAQLPVQLGHYGTLNSIVSLIIVMVIWLSYDLFDVDTDKDGRGLRVGRCCLLGLLCGWGISIKYFDKVDDFVGGDSYFRCFFSESLVSEAGW